MKRESLIKLLSAQESNDGWFPLIGDEEVRAARRAERDEVVQVRKSKHGGLEARLVH